MKHSDLSRAEESNVTGGGLCILQYNSYNRSSNIIAIVSNQFINNSDWWCIAYGVRSLCKLFFISTSNFIGNTAGTAGGAIGFIVHQNKCNYNGGAIPFGFIVTLLSCNIINNKAKFGGGVAIQIVHYEYRDDGTKVNDFLFHICHFIGNKAVVSSAVDINGRSQKVYQCLKTVIKFQL